MALQLGDKVVVRFDLLIFKPLSSSNRMAPPFSEYQHQSYVFLFLDALNDKMDERRGGELLSDMRAYQQ